MDEIKATGELADQMHDELMRLLEPEYPVTPMENLEHQIRVVAISDKFCLCYFFADKAPLFVVPIINGKASEAYWSLAEKIRDHWESSRGDWLMEAASVTRRILTNDKGEDRIKSALQESQGLYGLAAWANTIAIGISVMLKKHSF